MKKNNGKDSKETNFYEEKINKINILTNRDVNSFESKNINKKIKIKTIW